MEWGRSVGNVGKKLGFCITHVGWGWGDFIQVLHLFVLGSMAGRGGMPCEAPMAIKVRFESSRILILL